MSAILVSSAAAQSPDAPAIIADPGVISFRQLAERVRARVEIWRASGVETAGRVLGLSPRLELESLVSIYAALEHQLPVVLFHPRLTAAERGAACAAVPGLIDLDAAALAPVDTRRLPPELSALDRGDERAAALFFTSGTSGQAKLAVLSRRAVLASAAMSAAHLGWTSHDRWLLSIPLAHVGGLSILTRSLIARRPIVLPSNPGAFDPGKLLHDLERHQVTLLSVVPTMLEALLEEAPSPPVHLRAVLVGGAPLSPSTRERAVRGDWPLVLTYGLTEACSQVTATSVAKGADPGAAVGRPLPGVKVQIREGTIWIRGPNLFSGYLEAGRRASALDPEGWFDTQDLGHLDELGQLHVEARRTDLILSGGENVYPRELELALEAEPGVLEALVVAVPDPRWGQRPVALLRVAPGFDEAAARAGLERLAAYKRPKAWIVLEELPRNAMGKLDRREGQRIAQARL